MGWKEYHHAIHWGRQEPSPEWNLEAEPSAIELIHPESIREEIVEIYQDMYQLWKSPGKLPCDGETEELLQQEILYSTKEHLWHKWIPTPPGEESSKHPTSSPRHEPQANYSAQNHATYDWFNDIIWGSYKEDLTVVRDAYWQALRAAALLED